MYFKGKKILVIGGTGTIGQSVVRSLLKEEPQFIRIFSRDEHKQHIFKSELGNLENVYFMIGDIRNYDRVYRAMQDVDYVFHLAAMKHVDICEINPYEAVMTNIIGMNHVIEAALKQNVKKVVFTSSDKAISPTNTYGATKLIAEKLISATERNLSTNNTIFASVRFGNVMGSRGSVIPLFKKQILNDRKLTVTDMDMTRFMMTVKQATDLTIQALKEAKGGEVFVLKMPVIHLGSLVEVLIDELCTKHHLNKEDIDIQITGLRPGEKMYEELMTFNESKIAWDLLGMYVLTRNGTQTYPTGRKAKVGTYSSDNEKQLSKDEIRQLLKQASLI